MSTARMIRMLDGTAKPIITRSGSVDEQELLKEQNIDTCYYHPSNHPNVSIRSKSLTGIDKTSTTLQADISEAVKESALSLKK